MGYYTNYSLSVLNDRGADLTILKNELNEKFGEDLIDDNGETEEIKWYSWEEDMLELSKKYPDMLIEIRGDGEEGDDFWEARFKDGQEEYHAMQMPQFLSLIDTSKKSKKYYYDHITSIAQCEEFDKLAEAISKEVPELVYDEVQLKGLRGELFCAALNFISGRADKIIL